VRAKLRLDPAALASIRGRSSATATGWWIAGRRQGKGAVVTFRLPGVASSQDLCIVDEFGTDRTQALRPCRLMARRTACCRARRPFGARYDDNDRWAKVVEAPALASSPSSLASLGRRTETGWTRQSRLRADEVTSASQGNRRRHFSFLLHLPIGDLARKEVRIKTVWGGSAAPGLPGHSHGREE
jgi:hypothetical protein